MKVGSKFKFSSWILSTMNVQQKVLCSLVGSERNKNSMHICIIQVDPGDDCGSSFRIPFPNIFLLIVLTIRTFSNRREHLYTKPAVLAIHMHSGVSSTEKVTGTSKTASPTNLLPSPVAAPSPRSTTPTAR